MTFKNLAKKAKDRLTMTSKTQEKVTSRALSVQNSYYISSRMISASSDPLYAKVKKMLEANPDISSPIGKLIEKEVYDTLNAENRDRYLLDLTKRYNAMKKEYEEERRLALNNL